MARPFPQTTASATQTESSGSGEVASRSISHSLPLSDLWEPVDSGRRCVCKYKGPAQPDGCQVRNVSGRVMSRHLVTHALREISLKVPISERIPLYKLGPGCLGPRYWRKFVSQLLSAQLRVSSVDREPKWELENMMTENCDELH